MRRRIEVAQARSECRAPARSAPEAESFPGDEVGWAGPVERFGEVAEWHAGFPNVLATSGEAFLRHAPDIFASAPITGLNLHDVNGVAEQVFAHPTFARVRTLSFRVHPWDNFEMRVTDREVELLVASPHVGGLRWLDLGGNEVTDAGIEAIASSDRLSSLEYLAAEDNPCRSVSEDIGWEYTRLSDYIWPSAFAEELEARHGYKRWLHPYELSPHPDGPQRSDFALLPRP